MKIINVFEGFPPGRCSFIESRIIVIGTTIVIGPNLKQIIYIVIRGEIPWIIGRKIADDEIDSMPCLSVKT
jgi:hypothetical protein